MADRLHLSTKHRRVLETLLREHLPDVEVWAYGSRVNGRSHDGSDLDLVLLGPGLKEIPSGQLGDFEEAVRESTIPFLVEACDWVRLPERFHREIERNFVVLVGINQRSSHAVHKWQIATIEDIAEKVAMGPFGSSIKVATFVPEGIPVISGQHLHGNRVDDSSGFNFVTLEHATQLNNANVKRGDIIFTHAGNIGQVAYVPKDSMYDRYIISQRQFYMRCNPSRVIPEFATLFFHSPEGRHLLLANASQVGVPSISRPVTYLRTLEIPLPPLPEQRAIAHILGTLDDKIELNRHMNETLEEMARALFKSWFIDFDPVRARMEGRDTGLPKDIADFFPDRLVESELGEIPEGWEVKALGEIVELAYGKALKANNRNNGCIPVYGSNGQVGWHDEKLVTGPGIVVGRKGNPGVVNWVHCDFFPIDTTFYVVPRGTNQSVIFLFFTLANQDLVSVSADSAVPGLNRNLAYMNLLTIPDKTVIEKFSNYVNTIFSRRRKLEEETRILTALRDVLLPKLVSGEIRTCHEL